MFERFAEQARQVVVLAQEEARGLKHDHIGAEHILLGLVRENEGVAARILLDSDADPEKVRNEVFRLLPSRGVARQVRQGRSTSRTVSATDRVEMVVTWLGELGPVLDQLGAEIRGELGRDPDVGDLLLVLACAHDAVPARALDDLGVDLEALCGTIERVRGQGLQPQAQARKQLAEQITTVRAAKEQALEEQEFERARELRDRERQLTKQQAS